MAGSKVLPFATKLRDLRAARGLSLADVERLSAAAAVDSAGPVSRGYLHQLEQGRDSAPSIGKLLTLAAIYCCPVDDLIGALSEQERERTSSSLRDWRASGFREPSPLWADPDHVSAINSKIDAEINARAKSVMVSLDISAVIQPTIRRMMMGAAVMPYLYQRPDLDVLNEFWNIALARGMVPAADVPPGDRGIVWRRIVGHLVDWLLYEAVAWQDLLSALSSWHGGVRDLDEAGWLIGCRYAPPEVDSLFGFQGLPLPLVEGTRWRSVASVLTLMNISRRGEFALSPSTGYAAAEYVACTALRCKYAPGITASADGGAFDVLRLLATPPPEVPADLRSEDDDSLNHTSIIGARNAIAFIEREEAATRAVIDKHMS